MTIHDRIATYLQGEKVNYDKELMKHVEKWKLDGRKPTILLHSCCAPCSTYSLERLCEHAQVTLYFSNSNIYPEAEYKRRAHVQKSFVEAFNQKTGKTVGYLEAPYKPNTFIKMVRENELQDEPEGRKRCTACFDMRLDDVAHKAHDLGFDYFGTALTVSPHKNSQIVNAVGYEIQKVYDVSFLPADFKKNGGFYRSVEMCDEYDLYRQCYCGCVYAARQQGVDLKTVNQEAKDYLKENK